MEKYGYKGTPHIVDIAVGRRIRNMRLKRQWTQKDLAEKLHVSLQQVQKYETAGNRVSASRLWEVAEALEVSIVELLMDWQVSQQIAVLSEQALKTAQQFDKIQDKKLRTRLAQVITASVTAQNAP